MNFPYAVIQHNNKLLNEKKRKVSSIGIGVGHYGIGYRRYSK